ncbi:MAG TPA: D-2-hydroxyacid dehydrogenase [Steroidobacteraceae bacterium]|nr:D-2-hydroxyacid dehydrogenase [Steroidobacteraceae bacterium]
MSSKAVFLDFATVSNGDLDPGALRAVLPQLTLHDFTPDARIGERMAGSEMLLLNKLQITRELMVANPQLRLIAVSATGTNNIDLQAARERGIAVCNVRDYCTRSVMQHVLAVILEHTHRLRQYRELALASWSRSAQFTMLDYPIRELCNRTLGIIGYGTLGRAVAQAAQAAFDMRILVAARPGTAAAPGRVDLDTLLSQSDVVSLHCPLTAQTLNLIGERELALMKPDALLVNTARGGLIDSAALARALAERRIAGAAIDVLPQEPPLEGNPLLDAALPNLLVTPHVAWAAREARQRCLDEMAANIAEFLRGGTRNRVV